MWRPSTRINIYHDQFGRYIIHMYNDDILSISALHILSIYICVMFHWLLVQRNRHAPLFRVSSFKYVCIKYLQMFRSTTIRRKRCVYLWTRPRSKMFIFGICITIERREFFVQSNLVCNKCNIHFIEMCFLYVVFCIWWTMST